jgi:hypothetical protein
LAFGDLRYCPELDKRTSGLPDPRTPILEYVARTSERQPHTKLTL